MSDAVGRWVAGLTVADLVTGFCVVAIMVNLVGMTLSIKAYNTTKRNGEKMHKEMEALRKRYLR